MDALDKGILDRLPRTNDVQVQVHLTMKCSGVLGERFKYPELGLFRANDVPTNYRWRGVAMQKHCVASVSSAATPPQPAYWKAAYGAASEEDGRFQEFLSGDKVIRPS